MLQIPEPNTIATRHCIKQRRCLNQLRRNSKNGNKDTAQSKFYWWVCGPQNDSLHRAKASHYICRTLAWMLNNPSHGWASPRPYPMSFFQQILEKKSENTNNLNVPQISGDHRLYVYNRTLLVLCTTSLSSTIRHLPWQRAVSLFELSNYKFGPKVSHQTVSARQTTIDIHFTIYSRLAQATTFCKVSLLLRPGSLWIRDFASFASLWSKSIFASKRLSIPSKWLKFYT